MGLGRVWTRRKHGTCFDAKGSNFGRISPPFVHFSRGARSDNPPPPFLRAVGACGVSSGGGDQLRPPPPCVVFFSPSVVLPLRPSRCRTPKIVRQFLTSSAPVSATLARPEAPLLATDALSAERLSGTRADSRRRPRVPDLGYDFDGELDDVRQGRAESPRRPRTFFHLPSQTSGDRVVLATNLGGNIART